MNDFGTQRDYLRFSMYVQCSDMLNIIGTHGNGFSEAIPVITRTYSEPSLQ